MGVEFAKDSPKGATIPLKCTDVYMLGASEVLSSDELSVLTSVTVDNGLVGAAIYDFVDIEAFCQENVSYVDNLFSSLLGEDPDQLSGQLLGRHQLQPILVGSEPDQHG